MAPITKWTTYGLYNGDNNVMYVGSCKMSIGRRMKEHRYHSQQPKSQHLALYQYANKYGWDHLQVRIFDTFEPGTVNLRVMEQELIDGLQPPLNAIRAYISKEDQREVNRQRMVEYREQKKKNK